MEHRKEVHQENPVLFTLPLFKNYNSPPFYTAKYRNISYVQYRDFCIYIYIKTQYFTVKCTFVLMKESCGYVHSFLKKE